MAVVQAANEYQERMDDAYAGMIATGTLCITDTYVAATGQNIAYGVAVQRGANAGECVIGATGTATALTNFLGVAIATPTRLADVSGANTSAHYNAGDNLTVLSQGDIWVQVDGAVAVGDDVTVTDATGELGTSAADAAHSPVPGMWLTAAGDNGIAKVRLFGTIA